MSLDELEKDYSEHKMDFAELKSIVIGPPPQRNNRLRGTVQKLEERFNCYDKEDTTVRVANINLKGIYIMGALQFIGMVLVALIAKGVI
jgi:hypothetical protein